LAIDQSAIRHPAILARPSPWIEIALSLAIIGFALVAIIGVLPTGLMFKRTIAEEPSSIRIHRLDECHPQWRERLRRFDELCSRNHELLDGLWSDRDEDGQDCSV